MSKKNFEFYNLGLFKWSHKGGEYQHIIKNFYYRWRARRRRAWQSTLCHCEAFRKESRGNLKTRLLRRFAPRNDSGELSLLAWEKVFEMDLIHKSESLTPYGVRLGNLFSYCEASQMEASQ